MPDPPAGSGLRDRPVATVEPGVPARVELESLRPVRDSEAAHSVQSGVWNWALEQLELEPLPGWASTLRSHLAASPRRGPRDDAQRPPGPSIRIANRSDRGGMMRGQLPDAARRAARPARGAQRSFEERLGRRIGEMDEAQRSRAALLDAALRQVNFDVHRLASSLLDIAASIRRLEDKLDGGAAPRKAGANLTGGSETDASESSPWREGDLAAGDKQRLPTASQSGHGNGGVGSGAGASKENGAGAEQVVVPRHGSAIQGSRAVEGMANLNVQNEEMTSESAGGSGRPVRPGPRNFCRALRSGDLDAEAGAKVELEAAVGLCQLDTKLAAMDKKLEKITASMGLRSGANMGDDEEDRKRLKEKLKLAIELDKRSRIRNVVSKGEVWMEYIFGICSPDQRIGKRGSRYSAIYSLDLTVHSADIC